MYKTMLLIYLLIQNIQALCSYSQGLTSPKGIANRFGECYINASLQALFTLAHINHNIKTKSTLLPQRSFLAKYLQALNTYQSSTYENYVSLTYDKLRSQQNEPTDIVQKFILEYQQSLAKENDISLTVIDIEKYNYLTDTIKNCFNSRAKYHVIIINNPMRKTIKSIFNNKKLKDPSLIDIQDNKILKLIASINSCYLKTKNERLTTPIGANHSSSYVNYDGQWFFCNDYDIQKTNTTKISKFLQAKTNQENTKHTPIFNLSPGILFYETIHIN
jgi:hypothetical protein